MPQNEEPTPIVELPVGTNMSDVIDRIVRLSAAVVLTRTEQLNASQAMGVLEKSTEMQKEQQNGVFAEPQTDDERRHALARELERLGFRAIRERRQPRKVSSPSGSVE